MTFTLGVSDTIEMQKSENFYAKRKNKK